LLEQAIQTLTQHVAALTETVKTLDQSIKAANTISAKPKATRKPTKASASKDKAEAPREQVQIDANGNGVTMSQAPQPQAPQPQAPQPQAPQPQQYAATFVPGQGYSPGVPPYAPHAPEAVYQPPPPPQAPQQYAPPAQPLPPPANQAPLEITEQTVRDALVGLYKETMDNTITAQILAPFGAKTAIDLKPDQLVPVYNAIQERRAQIPRRG
jgi:hypothetical protein